MEISNYLKVTVVPKLKQDLTQILLSAVFKSYGSFQTKYNQLYMAISLFFLLATLKKNL